MKELQARQWQKSRAKGFQSYVLKRGILGWGVPMYVVFGLLRWMRHPEDTIHALVWGVPLWLSGGIVFGVATWYFSDRQYREYVSKHGEPTNF